MNKKFLHDVILVGVILLAAAIVLIIFKANQQEGKFVKIIVDKEVKHCYNFNKDAELVIKNGENTNTLVIKNGEAYISHANCPDKLCVEHRPISDTGEVIVCLPHKLVVQIAEE